MPKQLVSLTSVFRESGHEMLSEALAETSGTLLERISPYGLDGQRQGDSTEVWSRLDRPPKAEDIDYVRTSDDLLLLNRAYLRTQGGGVTW